LAVDAAPVAGLQGEGGGEEAGEEALKAKTTFIGILRFG
jgi:hypothetical protein